MIECREWVAVIIFIAGLSGFYSLISNGFEWFILFAMAMCFVLAYIIWPSKRKGQRDEGGRLADILECVLEFPVDFFLWILRFFGRLFGRKGEGVDIDFDI